MEDIKENTIKFPINEILERIQPFEKERQKRLLKLILREALVFTLLYFLINGLLLCISDSDAVFGFSVMIAAAVSYSCYDIIHTNKTFKNFIKFECSDIIKKNFKRSVFPILKEELNKSNLFGYFEDINTDDGFCGTYNNVDYKIADCKLTAKSPKKFDIQIFKGLIVMFDFNKKILKDTIVSYKNDDSIRQNLHGLNIKRFLFLFGIIIGFVVLGILLSCANFDFSTLKLIVIMLAPGVILCSLAVIIPSLIMHIKQQRKNPMEKTLMEDIVFNKDYIVHTKDATEARYLITTAFMDRYLKLQKIFKTKNIKCSFFDDKKLMFAIPTQRDLFEIGNLFISLNNKTNIENFYNDITEILKIIDIFKLNEKLGL